MKYTATRHVRLANKLAEQIHQSRSERLAATQCVPAPLVLDNVERRIARLLRAIKRHSDVNQDNLKRLDEKD